MTSELFYKAAYLIQDHTSFDNWEYKGVGHKVQIPDLGLVTLVEHQADDEYDRFTDSYYGEAPQGYEGVIALVFRVEPPNGAELFVKKLGSKDSYGTESWDGKIVQVVKTTKTVTAFAEV